MKSQAQIARERLTMRRNAAEKRKKKRALDRANKTKRNPRN